MKLEDAIDFNPIEKLSKSTYAKKIGMDKLTPFYKYIDSFENEKYSGGAKFRNGDTIIARITPCLENGKTAYIDFLDDDEIAFGSTEFIVMRNKKNVTIPEYIYYLSISPRFREKAISLMTGTSGRQRVQLDPLKEEIFYISSIHDQIKTVKILATIDEKIKLNSKINNNLHELCRKIFEQTFNYDMSFDSLDNLCSEITRGYTKNYVEKSNLINLNQKVNKGQKLEKQYYKYLDENQEIPKNRYVRKNDILLNSLGEGTLGRIHLFEENANNIVIDQHISILRASAKISPYYLYYLLSSNEYQNKIENSVTGTTGMLMLNISVVRGFKIPVPDKKDIDYFDSIAKACMNKITINTLENEKLSELRDTLLPKLMNGEIDLDNIEI